MNDVHMHSIYLCSLPVSQSVGISVYLSIYPPPRRRKGSKLIAALSPEHPLSGLEILLGFGGLAVWECLLAALGIFRFRASAFNIETLCLNPQDHQRRVS